MAWWRGRILWQKHCVNRAEAVPGHLKMRRNRQDRRRRHTRVAPVAALRESAYELLHATIGLFPLNL